MRRLTYYVIAVHVFFLLWSALWVPSKKTEKKPLQVRMVVQAPPPMPAINQEVKMAKTANPIPGQAPQQPAPKPKNPPPKTETAKPQPTAKPPPAKTPAAKAAPTVKKTASAPVAPSNQQSTTSASKPAKKEPLIPENLVQQLQESIAKIEQKSHKGSSSAVSQTPNLQTPKWVPQLKIDEGSVGEESVFVATLIQCLQETLNLPEMGSVRVELVLKSDGSFLQMKVLKSESDRNKRFLEQEIKKIKFPPFSGSLKDEKEHAFVITFCNS